MLTGGCACGAIRYECSDSPLAMLNCHCRDCQHAGGAGHAPTLVVATSALRVTRGSTKHYFRVADSGSTARREFCAECGSPLFAGSSARSGITAIRAGSLDDPRAFVPTADVWVASVQPWDAMDPALPKFERNRER